MSNPYLPLVVPRPNNVLPIALTQEAKYWSSAKTISSHTFHDPVTDVAFKPVEPHDLAVSFGFSISLISPGTGEIRKTLSRFRDLTYSPNFKHDGRLLVAGSGDGVVKVFDVNQRTPLRMLTGHRAAVRSSKFSMDGLHILSGSDDSTVRMWDLATSTCLFSLTDATDYVRAQNSSPASRHIWATGSVDGKARLYDLRSKKCIFTLNHSSQVDDVHILPGGARAVTVGGSDVRVWDFFAGGKIVGNLACHAKAVTSAAVDATKGRLVTAGLDGKVKVHDLTSLQTQGILSFEAQIMSLDVSSDGRRFGVGMADGAVEIRAVDIAKVAERRTSLPPGSEGGVVQTQRNAATKLSDYDHSLKSFRHVQALDRAVASKDPAKFLSVVDELISRGNLVSALDCRTQEEICPLLLMVRNNIGEPAHCKRMVLFLNALLDVCACDFVGDSEADRLLKAILNAVTAEVKVCRELKLLQGGVDSMTWVPHVREVDVALASGDS